MALHRSAESVLLGSIDPDIQTLQRDGIVARKRAFSREFIERMREDMMTAFWEAIQRPGGTICRIVEKLVPVTQKHDIEGLVMG